MRTLMMNILSSDLAVLYRSGAVKIPCWASVLSLFFVSVTSCSDGSGGVRSDPNLEPIRVTDHKGGQLVAIYSPPYTEKMKSAKVAVTWDGESVYTDTLPKPEDATGIPVRLLEIETKAGEHELAVRSQGILDKATVSVNDHGGETRVLLVDQKQPDQIKVTVLPQGATLK